ncbi:DUF5993 family protein [Candidatus Cyrtobacter comes]
MVFVFLFLSLSALIKNERFSFFFFYTSFATGIFWFVYHTTDQLNLSF